ncbi:MAG TPA: 4'-phosphopantetheinyl transferase superfamily protein [Bacteroidales bacterium]|jgi:phosphopantetheinyl transferase|nr:4'-phosphopantetheinyl transferase superfamily protein [Bacteroidales bacterium]HOE58991.1 4'-phosphopantetheinyl transferase superfamily protein [Bacteroidales bacterium]HOR04765.1 4'-phosphopantetheinyl transferase superfamily protein [Bacteroidales bacterium]HOU34536.1 4'-phosphopantetheinyl transferase superfamily protein [Bacteroidales bacterium]HPL33921.1 4'-phosphopantetheinyl transferase superfamily protein [Bacteroidales bacterium]
MPVNRIQVLNNGNILGLWQITESSEELIPFACLDPDEFVQFSKFKSPLRRLHWLAWRALLRKMIPESNFSLIYDDNGKPFPLDHSFQLSVSHSGNWATCFIDANHPVGLDLEAVHERVLKVKERFLSPLELEYFSPSANDPFVFTVLWSAKEAVFKYIGQKGINFRQQITIEPFSPYESHSFFVNIHHNSLAKKLVLKWQNIDSKYLLVHTQCQEKHSIMSC